MGKIIGGVGDTREAGATSLEVMGSGRLARDEKN